MKRKNLLIGLMCAGVCVLMTALGFYIAYAYLTVNALTKPEASNIPPETQAKVQPMPESAASQNILAEEEAIEASAVEEDKISPSTKMVYKYYYEYDNRMEMEEEEPPYFLIDMTREDLIDAFLDWTIESFSSKEVVMSKKIKGKSLQRYILGIHDGYVAVFYEEEIDGVKLKEVTSKPVSSLDEDEALRLQSGISIEGNEQLYKALEAYGS